MSWSKLSTLPLSIPDTSKRIEMRWTSRRREWQRSCTESKSNRRRNRMSWEGKASRIDRIRKRKEWKVVLLHFKRSRRLRRRRTNKNWRSVRRWTKNSQRERPLFRISNWPKATALSFKKFSISTSRYSWKRLIPSSWGTASQEHFHTLIWSASISSPTWLLTWTWQLNDCDNSGKLNTVISFWKTDYYWSLLLKAS